MASEEKRRTLPQRSVDYFLHIVWSADGEAPQLKIATRFPAVDWDDFPFPPSTPLFCGAGGYVESSQEPLPVCHSFVVRC